MARFSAPSHSRDPGPRPSSRWTRASSPRCEPVGPAPTFRSSPRLASSARFWASSCSARLPHFAFLVEHGSPELRAEFAALSRELRGGAEVSESDLAVVAPAFVLSELKQAFQIGERCRQALARWICYRHAPSGALFAWLVDPALEETLRTRCVDGAPALEPERVQALLEAVAALVEDGRAVLLASGDVRRPLRAICEGAFPEVAVLAYAELDPALRVKPLGRLSV